MSVIEKDVLIVGGGPAGMMAGLLLAHRGHQVLVIERERNFAREYRGEVLMPRFSQMMRQLHLEEWLLSLPHLKLKAGEIYFHDRLVGKLDFSRIAPEVPYALWLPQTVLLEGLYQQAKAFPSFEMWFGAQAKGLTQGGNAVTGAVVRRGNEEIQVKARVTIGSDGRWSTVLKQGGFEIEYEDYRFDVLWFTIPKPPDYTNTFKVMFTARRNFLLLPKYPDAIQVGILVPPKELSKMRETGIEALRADLRAATPLFAEFARSLKDFTPFHPLQAHLHYVKEWAREGCLLIGDSAHCFSPAGAIGVSMAVGTAIQAAEVIDKALAVGRGPIPQSAIHEVQRRRDADVRRVHTIQRRLTGGTLGRSIPIQFLLPFMVTVIARTPLFNRLQRQLAALSEPLPISPELSL